MSQHVVSVERALQYGASRIRAALKVQNQFQTPQLELYFKECLSDEMSLILQGPPNISKEEVHQGQTDAGIHIPSIIKDLHCILNATDQATEGFGAILCRNGTPNKDDLLPEDGNLKDADAPYCWWQGIPDMQEDDEESDKVQALQYGEPVGASAGKPVAAGPLVAAAAVPEKFLVNNMNGTDRDAQPASNEKAKFSRPLSNGKHGMANIRRQRKACKATKTEVEMEMETEIAKGTSVGEGEQSRKRGRSRGKGKEKETKGYVTGPMVESSAGLPGNNGWEETDNATLACDACRRKGELCAWPAQTATLKVYSPKETRACRPCNSQKSKCTINGLEICKTQRVIKKGPGGNRPSPLLPMKNPELHFKIPSF